VAVLYLGKLVDPKFVRLVPGNTLETAFAPSPYPSLRIKQAVLGIDDFCGPGSAGANDAEGMVL
jgi:hypothetical protein